MDRRTLLAITLILGVLLLPSIIMGPPAPPPGGVAFNPDSFAIAGDSSLPATDTAVIPDLSPPPDLVPPPPVAVTNGAPVVVESPLYRFAFSPRGARMVEATLHEYRSFAAGDTGRAQLIPAESGFLTYRLVFGTDTVDMSDWRFTPSAERMTVGSDGAELVWVARRGPATIQITYSFRPNQYHFDVSGRFTGIPNDAGLVLVGLGPRLRSVEGDSVADFGTFGVVTKARSTENLKFSSLDPGESRILDGPFEWVAIKSKYFIAAALAIEEGQTPFGGARATGGVREVVSTGFFGGGTVGTNVDVLASLPAPAGQFRHTVYIGPQEYRRLARIGHDLEDANPYGWILRPIIRPLSIVVVQIILWMHENLNLAYGWVLIVFGIAIRIALWPLNQKAMRSQMAMQALQPEMKAIQERYKDDRQKLQQEMMKLYKENGASPLGGCLPILIQMPILFTLFFVFLNTIELRGVPFLWLPDLSLADPLFIIPVLMGASMFALTKIGQIGVPPNPQTKMMLYVMPIMFTVLFFQFPSGLNLYYATSNVASLPQQWLVARERLRRAGKA